MAILPGTKNFKVDRRADFPIRLTFKDSTGSAIDLTGYTVAAQVMMSHDPQNMQIGL